MAEPPGQRWRSLLGELFRIQVDLGDPPGVAAGCEPGRAMKFGSVRTVARAC